MAYDDLRYDDVRQKSIHNTFQRIEGIYDQIVYWRVRSLEADIHRQIQDEGQIGTHGRQEQQETGLKVVAVSSAAVDSAAAPAGD